jgi:predicted transcriptional regulator of viral defense system
LQDGILDVFLSLRPDCEFKTHKTGMKKHISYRSSDFLSALISRKMDFFTLKEASEILPGKNHATLRKLLSDMARRGLIMRIRDGLYHRVPYEQDPDSYFPDWHLTAEAIVKPKEYYIGFYSALVIHGLITQPSMVEQVVTSERIKPKFHLIKSIRFEFITLNKKWFFGHRKQWIDDFNKVYCSDLEKTFLDCLYKPNYAGGITEITKALYKSRTKLQPEKFEDYLKKINSQSVYKRLGFILDELGIYPELQAFISGKIAASYIPLDPSLEKRGYYRAKWRIIDNIDFETSLDSIIT